MIANIVETNTAIPKAGKPPGANPSSEEAPRAQDLLWGPVANSFEAYRRRLIAEPAAIYEHIWRLIHIEEALIVTLGSALAARLFDLWKERNDSEAEQNLNQLRRLVTGLSGQDEEPGRETPGCMDGSISSWGGLLNRFSQYDIKEECPFCDSVQAYLRADPENPRSKLAFIEPWQRIGPVPEIFLNPRDRIGVLKAVNNLRNKLAHVPISEKILAELHKGLRREVLSLLTPETRWKSQSSMRDVPFSEVRGPLKGRLVDYRGYVSGSSLFGESTLPRDKVATKDVYFEWRNSAGDGEVIQWAASPFVSLDKELKPLLLFRVPGLRHDYDSGLEGEYHRFAAEMGPVQNLPIAKHHLDRWVTFDNRFPSSADAERQAGETSEPDAVAKPLDDDPAVAADKNAKYENEAAAYPSDDSRSAAPKKPDSSPKAAEPAPKAEEMASSPAIALATAAVNAALSKRQPLPPPPSSSSAVSPGPVERLLPSNPRELRDQAEKSFLGRDYEWAIRCFDKLEAMRGHGSYNDVARYKHGVALWRHAENEVKDRAKRLSLKERSIDALQRATSHRDPSYKARAYHELSKALYYKWFDTNAPSDYDEAIKGAEHAVKLEYESRYINWHERLMNEKPE